MLSQEVIDRIQYQLQYLESRRDQLVIDADTHITDTAKLPPELAEKYQQPNYYHGRPISAEDLIREMALAGVDMSLIWQNPAATPYGNDQEENFQRLLAANRYIFDSAGRHPDKFIPAGWTDPKALGLERALRLTDICLTEFGFFIVKMNPARNAYPIDSEEVLTIVDHIVEQGGIAAFHYGADTPNTPAEGLARIASRHPEHPLIAVHMGGGGAGYLEAEALYQKTRSMGLEYPNLFFPLSARRDTHTESDLITYQMAGAPFSHNLACASDAPYGRQAWNFGGYRGMFYGLMHGKTHTDERLRIHPDLFDEEVVQNYLGRNFANFTLRGYRHYLKVRDISLPGQQKA